jgi:hypothetical protein
MSSATTVKSIIHTIILTKLNAAEITAAADTFYKEAVAAKLPPESDHYIAIHRCIAALEARGIILRPSAIEWAWSWK